MPRGGQSGANRGGRSGDDPLCGDGPDPRALPKTHVAPADAVVPKTHVATKQVQRKAKVPPVPWDHASGEGAGSSGHRHRDGQI
jgi:hypothetical protein